VGDDDHRQAVGCDFRQYVDYLSDQRGVQRGCRLVDEHEVRSQASAPAIATRCSAKCQNGQQIAPIAHPGWPRA
jgi:hypothetical protein